MQVPDLPSTGQVQLPVGPQTIGTDGAASWINVQSESTLHGSSGMAQMPHPTVTPPGLHSMSAWQSALELQADAPESTGHVMFDSDTVQPPALHVAVVAHP